MHFSSYTKKELQYVRLTREPSCFSFVDGVYFNWIFQKLESSWIIHYSSRIPKFGTFDAESFNRHKMVVLYLCYLWCPAAFTFFSSFFQTGNSLARLADTDYPLSSTKSSRYEVRIRCCWTSLREIILEISNFSLEAVVLTTVLHNRAQMICFSIYISRQ
jgi:hypothetical protein